MLKKEIKKKLPRSSIEYLVSKQKICHDLDLNLNAKIKIILNTLK